MNRFFKTVALLLSQVLYSVMLYLIAFCISSMLVFWTIIVCEYLGMDVSQVRMLHVALCGSVPIWIVFEINVWIRVARSLQKERRLMQAQLNLQKNGVKLSENADDVEEEKSEEEILAEEALFLDGENATEEPQEEQ